jgi:tetratricopeptide (TPR) repeat protein
MKYSAFVLLLFTFCVAGFGQEDRDVGHMVLNSEAYNQQGLYAEAIEELTKAIAIEPGNADLYLKRAAINPFGRKASEISDDVYKAVSLKTGDKQTVLKGTRILRNIRRCDDALGLLNVFLFKNTMADDAFYARAHVKMCLDDWKGAYEDMTRAVELAPKNSNYLTTQAGLLSKLGETDKALEKFAQMIKDFEAKLAIIRAPGNSNNIKRELSQVYISRARIYHHKGELAAELADLLKYIEYSPKDINYTSRARFYVEHKMFDEAIADFTEAIRLSNMKTPGFIIERGDVYVFAGKYEEAFKDYETALTVNKSLKAFIDTRIIWAKRQMQEKTGKTP